MVPEKFSKTSFDDEHGSYVKVLGYRNSERLGYRNDMGIWGKKENREGICYSSTLC